MAQSINFDFTTMRWQGLTVEQIDLWCALYPDVDVVNQLKFEMPRWLDKQNGKKVARKKNWKAFIVGWLRRAEMRAVGI